MTVMIFPLLFKISFNTWLSLHSITVLYLPSSQSCSYQRSKQNMQLSGFKTLSKTPILLKIMFKVTTWSRGHAVSGSWLLLSHLL